MNCKILKAKDYIASLNKKMPKNLYAGWRERTICLVHGPREGDESSLLKESVPQYWLTLSLHISEWFLICG